MSRTGKDELNLVAVFNLIRRSDMAGRIRRVPTHAAVDFDAFWYAEYRSVVGLAYVLVGDALAAEELTQDAFTEAHAKWDKVSQYDKPEAWVRRVLVNKSRSRFRKLKTEAGTLAKLQAAPTLHVHLPERSDEIWNAVRSLPKRQAQVVALRYWDEYGISEIADILDCSTETVRTHLKRGRSSLAEKLGADYGADAADVFQFPPPSPPEHRGPNQNQPTASDQRTWS